jgi:hypothetical protein
MQRRLKQHQLTPGHQRVERRLLERDPDRAPHAARIGDYVVPGDPGAATGRAQQRREHAHRRRLARAIGPEERVDLLLGDLQVDSGHGQHLVGEPPLQPPHLDRRHPRDPRACRMAAL